MTRTCLPCTECCRGSLSAQVGDFHLCYGHPCPDVTLAGCGRGDTRPMTPCKTFKCGWLMGGGLPEALRPDLCKAIVVDGEEYATIIATQDQISPLVKQFFIDWAISTKIPIVFKEIQQDSDGPHYYITPVGSKTFVNEMNARARTGRIV